MPLVFQYFNFRHKTKEKGPNLLFSISIELNHLRIISVTLS